MKMSCDLRNLTPDFINAVNDMHLGHNGWACLQYITIKALKNYGYNDIAKIIAQKYTSLVENVFEKTGRLWEKYNVALGNINVNDEYKMPSMLGWSAGVYLALKDMLS